MLTLLTGGARSGKSALAVRIAERANAPVVVIATAEARDDEMAERIRAHQAARPEYWTTFEEPTDLGGALERAPADAVVVIDCLTLWVANVMERGRVDVVESATDAARLAASRSQPVIVVTNEVGSGIVPGDRLSRDFRDVLGAVNAVWASLADRCALVVAGGIVPVHDASELLDA